MSDRKTKLVRLSPDAHARLLRLADRTGLLHPEIVTRALDCYEKEVAAHRHLLAEMRDAHV